jgi:hypothetical protein
MLADAPCLRKARIGPATATATSLLSASESAEPGGQGRSDEDRWPGEHRPSGLVGCALRYARRGWAVFPLGGNWDFPKMRVT